MNRLAAAATLVIATSTTAAAKNDIGDSDFVVVEAAPLAEKVAPQKPTWCDAAKDTAYSTGALSRAMQRAMKDGWDREITQTVAEALCAAPELPGYQKQTAYFLQAWVNMTGMTVPEVVESVRLRMDKAAFENGGNEVCNTLIPGRDLSKNERGVITAQRAVLGCDAAAQWRVNDSEDLRYAFEEWSVPPSPLVLVYEVRQCLHDFESPTWQMGYDHLFRYAVCKPAINRLDRAAFFKYLDDTKASAYTKIVARESFSVAQRLAARYAAIAEKQIAENAAFRSVFEAAEPAWAAWEKERAANAAAFDAANAYRKLFFGPSKKARAGCFDGLRDHLVAAIVAAKPKTLDEAKQLQAQSLGYNLTAALMLCAAADGQSVFSNMLNASRSFPRYQRGPRAAAYYAVVEALGEVLADQDRFPMKPGYFAGESFEDLNNEASYARGSGSFGTPVEGIVEKTEKKGDNVKVTFKKTTRLATMYSCKDTNRIERIDPGGRVVYRQDCQVTGQEKVDSTVDPLLVPAWMGKGLVKGGLGQFYCSDNQVDGVRLCYTTAGYKDKDGKQLSNFLGAELK